MAVFLRRRQLACSSPPKSLRSPECTRKRGRRSNRPFLHHNAFESQNVEAELRVAARAAATNLKGLGHLKVAVGHKEFGLAAIEALYRSRDKHILVDQQVTVTGKVIATEKGEGWKAVVASVQGKWLKELFEKYNTDEEQLFSANLREWLGARKSESNINAGIIETAKKQPEHFWVYNNGITAVSNKVSVRNGVVTLRGISII